MPSVSISENAFVNDGIVHFKSIQSYVDLIDNGSEPDKESIVKKLDGTDKYTPQKRFYDFKNSEQASRSKHEQLVDAIQGNEFINTLVNSDGLISIGDYYFKVSLENEKCYVLPSQFKDELKDLIAENVSNKNVLTFSTTDDVLDLLEGGVKGTINGRTQGLFCKEDGASGKDDDRNFYVEDRFRQNNRVTYYKAGIYFSLNAKTKTQYKSDVGLWVPNASCNQYIQYYCIFKPKCQGEGFEQGIINDAVDDRCDNELNYRPYERARGLHYYLLQARFYGYDQLSDVYEVKDNY